MKAATVRDPHARNRRTQVIAIFCFEASKPNGTRYSLTIAVNLAAVASIVALLYRFV